MTEARCTDCGEFLHNVKNETHLSTEMESMKWGVNCGNCNKMNFIHTKVEIIEEV